MARPQLLFLSHRIPYPPNKGDKIRSWNILKHLARSFDVRLGTFIDDKEDMQYVSAVEEVCKEVFCLQVSPMEQKLRALQAWPGLTPLSVAMLADKRMRDFVAAKCDAGQVQAAYIFSSQMAHYMLRHSTGKRLMIMDFVDVDSDKFKQYAAKSIWPMTKVYEREAHRLHQYEKQVARAMDACLFVSADEARLFRRHAGSYAHTVYALENGVDTAFFHPSRKGPAGQPSLIFTGAMDYPPNIEAALWTARDILPLVRAEFPETTFTIVGSNPAASVKALDGKNGITVTGRVEDVRPYFNRASVAVAPMQTARGVQNKVLEAMAMALPTVTTSQGHSGIDAEPGKHLMVAESAEEIAAAVVDFLRDPHAATAFGERAREHMIERYSWAHQMAELDRLIMQQRPGLMNGVAA